MKALDCSGSSGFIMAFPDFEDRVAAFVFLV
jgi:hypothetical protein